MDLSRKPPLMRVLCAEPLEGRWLLSGNTPADDAQVPPTPTIDLHDTERVSEDEEEDEDEVVIEESELPAEVLAAFRAEFHDAEIEEARREEDDERGIEYGITTEIDEREVEVTISPIGQIVEREREIDASELPQDVTDQLQAEKPGAEVTGGADLGDGSYEVLYTFDGEHWETEATPLSTPPPPAPPPVDEEPAETPTTPTTPAAPVPVADASLPVASSSAADPVVEAAPADSSESQQVAQADTRAEDAEAKAREDAIKKNAAAKAAAAATLPADRVAQALDALAAGAGAGVWLPDVAGALIDILPVNINAIEQSMRDVLRQVGSLAGNTKTNSAVTTGATRLAMAATLVAAVKVLLNQSRKASTTRPALVFGPARSSWGWVLGTVDPNRRRRISSRQREP